MEEILIKDEKNNNKNNQIDWSQRIITNIGQTNRDMKKMNIKKRSIYDACHILNKAYQSEEKTRRSKRKINGNSEIKVKLSKSKEKDEDDDENRLFFGVLNLNNYKESCLNMKVKEKESYENSCMKDILKKLEERKNIIEEKNNKKIIKSKSQLKINSNNLSSKKISENQNNTLISATNTINNNYTTNYYSSAESKIITNSTNTCTNTFGNINFNKNNYNSSIIKDNINKFYKKKKPKLFLQNNTTTKNKTITNSNKKTNEISLFKTSNSINLNSRNKITSFISANNTNYNSIYKFNTTINSNLNNITNSNNNTNTSNFYATSTDRKDYNKEHHGYYIDSTENPLAKYIIKIISAQESNSIKANEILNDDVALFNRLYYKKKLKNKTKKDYIILNGKKIVDDSADKRWINFDKLNYLKIKRVDDIQKNILEKNDRTFDRLKQKLNIVGYYNLKKYRCKDLNDFYFPLLDKNGQKHKNKECKIIQNNNINIGINCYNSKNTNKNDLIKNKLDSLFGK